MNSLEEVLRSNARDLGVELFGVADLSKVNYFILTQGGQHIGGYTRAVSLGLRLVDDVVDELSNHQDLVAISTYRGLYNVVNASLDRAAFMVAKRIQEVDFQAYPIPASAVLNNGKLEGAFSHKLAANLAGLGWIGKNCLLITPDHGPRLRLATVLTDALLEVGKPIRNGCGSCSRCVDICPVKALSGRAFDPSEGRDARFKANLCDEYTEGRIKVYGDVNCGLCMHVCPYGRRRSSGKHM